jgi:hypothetical protein
MVAVNTVVNSANERERKRQAQLKRQRERLEASNCYTAITRETEAERRLNVLVLPPHRSEHGSPGGHGC